MKNKKVIIFGGSGFLGLNLAKALLSRSYDVTIVSRNQPKKQGEWKFVSWNAQTLNTWVEDVKAFVNLAENCDAILRSRVDATKLIAKALKELKTPPKFWVQMSTAHRYGDSAEVICDENSTFGYGLAPFVGKKWEEAYTQGAYIATAWIVQLGAKFIMNTDPDLVLAGRYCVPKSLLDDGFSFTYPTIEEAFKDLFSKNRGV